MKPLKTLCIASFLLVALAFNGCATSSRSSRMSASSRPRSFALAVTVQGGLQPTPMQWAAIQASVAQYLAARNWVLVTDIALADHILRIDFVPSVTDPENSGHAQLVGIRDNPRSTVASRGMSPYPSSAFGYASYASYGNRMGFGSPFSSLYSNGYYGYGDFYNDGYSPGWSTVTPAPSPTVPSHPPYRHRPGDPAYCPPDPTVRPLPGVIAGNFTPTPVNDHPRPPPRDYGRWSSENAPTRSGESGRGYARSESFRGRSDSANVSGDSTRTRSEAAYARSEGSRMRSESTYPRPESAYRRSEASYSRTDGSRADASTRGDSTYSRSDSYTRGDSSYSSRSRSDSNYSRGDSPRGESSYSRGDNSHSRGESSSYSRGDSSHSRGDSSYSRGDSSHSRSESSYSRSESSHSRSESSHSAPSAPAPSSTPSTTETTSTATQK